MPIMGPVAEKAALARYFDALAGAYATGLPIHQALELVASSSANAYLTERLSEIKGSLARGCSLTTAARETGVLPPMALQMIAVGEETGRLDQLLDKVAKMYREDVERGLRSLAAKIEPIILAFMGGLVLIMALGIFLPMWNINSIALNGQAPKTSIQP